MKKLVILGTALLAINAVASEIQFKGGYDFSRNYKIEDSKVKFEKSPTLGAEYIFDNQGEFEWGLGGEYKFGRKSSNVTLSEDGERLKTLRVAPVYVLGKFNLYTTKKGNDSIYVLGRAGYSFAKVGRDNLSVSQDDDGNDVEILGYNKGGLYVAGGIGTEYGPYSLEFLYERSDLKAGSIQAGEDTGRDRVAFDSFGLRLGYRFGRLVNDRAPKIKEVVVTKEVIKEVPVEVIREVKVEAPATKEVNVGKNAVLPFSCAADEKKCVIRGFKVDGKEPNEAEAKDLRAIANVINQFAEGGTIDFVGHTDSTGTDAYNQKLSVSRAQNVARLLKEYGLKNTVSYGKISGKGETEPADTNGTVQGRYNNRRVELFFQNVDFQNVKLINAE